MTRSPVAIVDSRMPLGQVVVMAVTSMAALGLIGGVVGDSEGTGLPQSIIAVYTVPALAGLLLVGVLIAVLGALLPARQAARVSTAAFAHGVGVAVTAAGAEAH